MSKNIDYKEEIIDLQNKLKVLNENCCNLSEVFKLSDKIDLLVSIKQNPEN